MKAPPTFPQGTKENRHLSTYYTDIQFPQKAQNPEEAN